MDKRFSRVAPKVVEEAERRSTYALNYNVEESTAEDIQAEWEKQPMGDGGEPTADFVAEHRYNYCRLVVAQGQWNYDGVINAIIRDKYRTDQMEAITNNMATVNAMFMQKMVSEGIVGAIAYLKESASGDDTEVFEQMQAWRKMAKEVAKSIFNR